MKEVINFYGEKHYIERAYQGDGRYYGYFSGVMNGACLEAGVWFETYQQAVTAIFRSKENDDEC